MVGWFFREFVRHIAPVACFLLLVIVQGVSSMVAAPAGDSLDGCLEVEVFAAGYACSRPDGHTLITLQDGYDLLVHGPDPPPPPGDVGFDLDSEQRPPVCATDHYLHVLYGYPESLPNRHAEVAESLREAVRRMNAVLNADALASGGVTADYKVLCDARGAIRVDAFAGPETGGSTYTADFSAVVAAARAAGFTNDNTDYLIFYDDSSDGVCGVGNLARDDRLSSDNANMIGADYGVSYESCWFGRTPMHENGHNQGAVQDLAPDWDLTGHCLEGRDVMCYPTSSFIVLCPDRTYFDCDYDTYFDAEPEPGEWLATHWNIGSRLNRYIMFDAASAPPALPPEPPIAAFTVSVTGLQVTVDASESSDPDGGSLEYRWDWGDGSAPLREGPGAAHAYGDPGSYTITLNVTDNQRQTAQVQREVTVSNEPSNRAPQADFAMQPDTPQAGDMVLFRDRSGDEDGSIVAWAWQFGDGASSTVQRPTYRYDAPGAYTVRLTVTDDAGATAVAEQVLHVAKAAAAATSPPQESVVSKEAPAQDEAGGEIRITPGLSGGLVVVGVAIVALARMRRQV